MTFYQEIIEALDRLHESGVHSADEVEVRVSPPRYRQLEHELYEQNRSRYDGLSTIQLRCNIGVAPVHVDRAMEGPAWTISRRMRHYEPPPGMPSTRHFVMQDDWGNDIESPPEPDPVEPGFLDELKGL